MKKSKKGIDYAPHKVYSIGEPNVHMFFEK